MTSSAVKTRAWDVAEHLESPAEMAAYLEAALEVGDAGLIAAALGDIAYLDAFLDIRQPEHGP